MSGDQSPSTLVSVIRTPLSKTVLQCRLSISDLSAYRLPLTLRLSWTYSGERWEVPHFIIPHRYQSSTPKWRPAIAVEEGARIPLDVKAAHRPWYCVSQHKLNTYYQPAGHHLSSHSHVQIVIRLDGGMSVTTITGQQLSITGPLRSYDLVNRIRKYLI